MTRSHQQANRSAVWPKILLAMVCFSLLICGGLAVWVLRGVAPAFQMAQTVLEDTVGSHDAALTFLRDVGANRLDEAYGATTEGFRQRTSRDDFESFVQGHEALQQAEPIDELELTFFVKDLRTRVFSYPIGQSDGSPLFAVITIVGDGVEYRVDDFDVRVREAVDDEVVPGDPNVERDSRQQIGTSEL